MGDGIIVDLFAGGGGASTGLEAALGRKVDVAVDHSEVAIACHRANHPRTRHFQTSVYDVDPIEASDGRPVGVLWASPDCTHFSRAKGDVPRDAGIRSLAWVVVRWAERLGEHRPRVIFLENVPEFLDWGPLGDDGRPDPARKGETFGEFAAALRGLGYRVEWRVLTACDYGAPTKRPRLFVVARCDGEPIVWPAPTHGPGRALPFRTAAECIDWSLPCHSIFLTPAEVRAQGLSVKRPLAEKTMRRIAEGVRRYVLEAGDDAFTVCAGEAASGAFVSYAQQGGGNRPATSPMHTITASRKDQNCVVKATLVQTGYGERAGQAPRVPGLHKPLGAVVAGGGKHALVAAFMAKHYGGVVGHEVERPLGTITGTDHHALTTAHLCKLRGACHSAPADAPTPTVTAGGTHLAEVRAFLIRYYSSGGNLSPAGRPMPTITAKHRMGLVTIHGADWQIVDIGMRMLEPRELLAAQFGDHALGYTLDVKKHHKGKAVPITKSDQIRLIGNSVPPDVVAALVRANCAAGAAQASGAAA